MPRELFGKSSTSYKTRDVDFTDPLIRVVESDSARAAFWSKVRKTSGCWLWTGPVNGSLGYGQFRHLGAHRIAWTLARGPIPGNQHVLHACDVPRCVNPDHLFLGTHRTNMEDAAKKGRLHVPRPRRQTVSDADVAAMRDMRVQGMPLVQIAGAFGVTKTYVSLVCRGKRRQHTPRDRREGAA